MGRVFELWRSQSEDSLLYLARDDNYDDSILGEQARTPDLVLVWTYEASSYFDAMRARNQRLGWEPYRPEPDWEDEAYP